VLQFMRLLRFEGRANRRAFVGVVGPLVALEVSYLVWLERIAPDGLGDSPWFWPSFVALFVPIALAAPTVFRRLHDLGHSGVWVFLIGVALRVVVAAFTWAGLPEAENPVLLAGLGAGLAYLALALGTPGENQFGPAVVAAD
jgi:uncharacterized membrane protein YhaH (DUF805 family)